MEEAVAKNHGQPAVIIAHSMGNLVSYYFLKQVILLHCIFVVARTPLLLHGRCILCLYQFATFGFDTETWLRHVSSCRWSRTRWQSWQTGRSGTLPASSRWQPPGECGHCGACIIRVYHSLLLCLEAEPNAGMWCREGSVTAMKGQISGAAAVSVACAVWRIPQPRNYVPI